MTWFSRFLRLSRLCSALDVWQQEGGYVAHGAGFILCDRAALRPDTPARNIRHRWQIIRNNADQTLIKLFRSRAAAERYLGDLIDLELAEFLSA